MNLCLAHGGDLADPSGGTDRVTAIAAGLADRGHDVTLVAPAVDGEFPDRLAEVDVWPVEARTRNALVTALTLTREAGKIADRQGARLQYEHSTLAGIAALRGQSGYVLDMHDLAHARFDVVEGVATPALRRATAWVERYGVRRADRVVAVSPAMVEELRSWGVDPDRVTVVPNGYFPDRIEPFRDADTVDGRVAFLGTLHPKVDVASFAAIADLPAVSELVVVGDGAQRAAAERLARDHDAVRYTGRLPDGEAFSLLAASDVAVNPQTTSALQRSSSPVKLYYYAALALPMVVTPGPPVVDDLVAADAAVAATGPEQFERAVGTLLDDDARRRTLSANARALAASFDWDRRVDAFEAVYGPPPAMEVA